MQRPISYSQLVGFYKGTLTVPKDYLVYVTNSTTGSTIRGTPYQEIILQLKESDTSYNVFNNVLKYLGSDKFFPTTSNADELIIPPTRKDYYRLIKKNDKRTYTMDSQVFASIKVKQPKQFVFRLKDVNKGRFIIADGCQTTYNTNSEFYKTTTVTRNSIFIYNSNTTIYMLIDYNNSLNTKYGYTIWIMQSYCNQIIPNLNFGALPLLYNQLKDPSVVGSGNTLPNNWAYLTYTIPEKQVVEVVAIGTAYVIQDGAGNSYQYLVPRFATELYNSVIVKK